MAVENKPDKLRVFISYSRRNIAFVDRLQSALNARGIDAAVDRSEIAKGEAWWKRIEQLIIEADATVFVLSPASAISSICQDEVDFAERLRKRIIPVVAEDVAGRNVPAALARLNYVFFISDPASGSTGEFDPTIDELVRVLETDIDWVREHTRIGALAQRWLTQTGRSRDLLLRGAELETAERWSASRPTKAPNLSDSHISFLAESRRAATRRQRRIVGVSVAAAGIATGLAGLAYVQRTEAVKQTLAAEEALREANRNDSLRLSEAARVLSDEPGGGDAQVAALLALEAMKDTESDDPLRRDRPLVAEAQFQLERALRNARESSTVVNERTVQAVSWSPDGRLIALGIGDEFSGGEARIIEPTAGKVLLRAAGRHAVMTVAWSPDSKLLATGSLDRTVRVVEPTTGEERARFVHSSILSSVAWSRDGRWLAMGSASLEGKGELQIVEPKTGHILIRIPGAVSMVAWSPSGRYVASAMDKTTRVIDSETGKEVARFAHEGLSSAVAWSRDGRLLAIGSGDFEVGEMKIVEPLTGQELSRLSFEGIVQTLGWSPTGRFLAAGARTPEKGDVRIIDAETFKELTRLTTSKPTLLELAWGADGKMLAIGSGDRQSGEARIVEAPSGRELARIHHYGAVSKLEWSPDGRRLATGSWDTLLRIVDIGDGTTLSGIGHVDWVWAVAWSLDGKLLATGSKEGARVFDAASGKEVVRHPHDGKVLTVAWSPDGHLMATGTANDVTGEIRVFETASGKELVRAPYSSNVMAVAWGPDGRRLAAAGMRPDKKGEVRILESANGKVLANIEHDDPVRAVAWSPAGNLVATGSGNEIQGIVRIVDPDTQKEVARIAEDLPVNAVAWSADGQMVASGFGQLEVGYVRIIEASSGREVRRLHHDAGVRSVSWSHDGHRLATGSGSGIGKAEAQIIEVATGRVLARFQHGGPVSAVAWSPNDATILTGSWDNTARLWRIFPTAQALVDAAKKGATRCLAQQERSKYFLHSAPPTWCVARQLWPYHGIDAFVLC